jgi:hypothetical protein
MKKLLLLGFLSTSLLFAQKHEEEFDKFFGDHVFPIAGYELGVNYAQIDTQQVVLINKLLTNQDDKFVNADERLAFLINVYNFWVIQKVHKNYPIGSPNEVDGFFDKKTQSLFGDAWSLNGLETHIREEYKKPAIHFALVCGAVGCPYIKPAAYHAEGLSLELESKALETLKNPLHCEINENDKSIKVSKIFEWYQQDFNTDDRNTLDYIGSILNKDLTGYNISYSTYNWKLNESSNNSTSTTSTSSGTPNLSNIFVFTPSSLLKSGQIEVKDFNNIYTQTKGFDVNRQKTQNANRDTYFGSFIQVLHGTHAKFNLGFDLYFKSYLRNGVDDSPFSILGFPNNNIDSRVLVSKFGPKIKITPFKKIKRLSIQQTILFPVAKDLEGKDSGKPWTDWDTYTSLTQFFYDKTLNDKLQFFAAAEMYFRIPRNSWKTAPFLVTPIKAFVSYFPSNKMTVYGMTEWGPEWGRDSNGSGPFSAYYTQIGIGSKYQVLPWLEFEVLTTKFPLGKVQGAGSTYNFGFRVLK